MPIGTISELRATELEALICILKLSEVPRRSRHNSVVPIGALCGSIRKFRKDAETVTKYRNNVTLPDHAPRLRA